MKPRIYVETTVISYLTARPSRDLIVAGHQKATEQWWQTRREAFELVTSQIVFQEAGAGDPDAAQQRLLELSKMTMLGMTDEALSLAKELVDSGSVPDSAAEDALHIAVAVTNGIEYLMTWNCRHLANAAMRTRIEEVCRNAGYEPVIICTPEELLEA